MILDSITKQRAQVVFELSKDLIRKGFADEYTKEAFRLSYLIIYGPKNYLSFFGANNLLINSDKADDGYREFRHDLVGPIGLTAEEEHIIFVHNREVEELLEQSSLCSL